MAGSRGKGKGGRGGGGGGRGGGGQGQNGQKKCFHCGLTNHISKDCTSPKNPNRNNGNKCPHCNQMNPKHTPDGCWKKPGGATPNGKGNNNPAGGNITRVCSKCQGWHLDKDCKVPANGMGANGQPISCRLCQGPHYQNQCPTKIGPANWASTNTTNTTSTDNTSNTTNPYLNSNGPGGTHQNTWNDAKFLTQVCGFCGKDHLIDDCPQRQYLAPGQQPNGAAVPPQPPVAWSSNQQQWGMPPQPPPANPTFPYQGFTTPQAVAPKYQDDADNTYSATNIYGHSGISAFASHSLGRNGNEYHKEIWNDRDGDVEMEDVDGCAACEFDPLEQVEMMRRREVEKEIANLRYQQEMQELARIGDVRGFGWGWKYP